MNESDKVPVYISSELLMAVSKVLRPGETAVEFIEETLRKDVTQREIDRRFLEKGLASGDQARNSSKYVSWDEVIKKLDGLLKRHRAGDP